MRKFEAAAEAYRQVLAKSPDAAEAAVNLGIVLQETGDLDRAMAAYSQAYRLKASTFGVIAMALTSAPSGRLWLDEEVLRRLLEQFQEERAAVLREDKGLEQFGDSNAEPLSAGGASAPCAEPLAVDARR
ncbi:tetratricopeptide repeat protein [Mesorhizobium atlanticum]